MACELFFWGDVVKRYLVVTLLVLLVPVTAWSLDSTMELGARGGVDTLDENENFLTGEIYYLYTLPWQKELSPSVHLYTRIDAGLAYLRADSHRGGWLAIGGDVVLSLGDGAWELEYGFRPAWLFASELGGDDFGGPIQFSNHIGTTLNRGPVALSYRFQHLSNASLYDDNPGLDLHMVGLGVRF